MNDNPLFSVLIANYNNGKYLMDAIKSVYEQTYTHWEIILVDDASTDNSHELYKELEKDERIRIFYNDENHGCGYTKRRCAELANGELCGFLDPDDAYTFDAIEIMVEEHSQSDEISLVYSNLFYCDDKLNIMSISQHQCSLSEGKTFLEYGNGAISHLAVFKREAYLQTCGIAPDMKRAVDHDLYFKLEEVGHIKYVPKPLYYYRQGTGCNISLGENSLPALFWDYVAMIDACRRRNKSIEDLVLPRFIDFILKYEKQLNSVYSSKTYKLGKMITMPYKVIKQIFNKI